MHQKHRPSPPSSRWLGDGEQNNEKVSQSTSESRSSHRTCLFFFFLSFSSVFLLFLSWAFQETSQKASRNSINTPQFRIWQTPINPTPRQGKRGETMLMLFFFVFRSKSRGGVHYIYRALFFFMRWWWTAGSSGIKWKSMCWIKQRSKETTDIWTPQLLETKSYAGNKLKT